MTVVDKSTDWLVNNLVLQVEAVKQIWMEFDKAIAQIRKDVTFPIEGDLSDPEAWADLIDESEEIKEEFCDVY